MTTVLYCYIPFVEGKPTYCAEVGGEYKNEDNCGSHIDANRSKEQIVEQIKNRSCREPCGRERHSDSVRMLAKDLKVSALTVKGI